MNLRDAAEIWKNRDTLPLAVVVNAVNTLVPAAMDPMIPIAAALIGYSFDDIRHFDELTDREKEIIKDGKTFLQLKEWMKGQSEQPRLDLSRGTLVEALRDLDPEGANVAKGTLGVVFEESNFYGDGCGPMVRWATGGACNVYHGDVIPGTFEKANSIRTPKVAIEITTDLWDSDHHRILVPKGTYAELLQHEHGPIIIHEGNEIAVMEDEYKVL